MTSTSSTRVLFALITTLAGCMAAPDKGDTSARRDGVANGTVQPARSVPALRPLGASRGIGYSLAYSIH